MRAFIDTSSLIKKYVSEEGSGKFDTLLEGITEIIVSPVYLLEVHSVIERRLKEKILSPQQASSVITEAKKDHYYFVKIIWNENLERKAVEFIEKYRLKTLDSIQLASAYLSKADVLITSDKRLFQKAKEEFKNAVLI